jgi:hypothetical protein
VDVPGVTLTLTLVEADVTENKVTEACAYFVGSATEVARTVIDCDEVTNEGAVYSPVFEMLPTAGVMDQVTPVLVV